LSMVLLVPRCPPDVPPCISTGTVMPIWERGVDLPPDLVQTDTTMKLTNLL